MKLSNLFLSLSLFLSLPAAAQQPVDYVDPFIGTTNFSVCNPGCGAAPRPDVGGSVQRNGL